MTFLAAAIAATGAAMGLAALRLFAGPSQYDRALAVNCLGTLTMLLIALMGFITGRPDFLDIALLYALVNFIGTIAILKFFRYRTLGDTGAIPPADGKAQPVEGENA